MTKALLKKQIMESFSWLYYNRKTGTRRDLKGVIGYGIIYLFVFGMLGYMFFTLASTLCEPLCDLGLGWFYFAIIGLIAIVLGVFGSVFNTFASLYQPKDNDMLLSMPIPVSKILIMRLIGVYMMGLMYEMIVMIPALIVWFYYGSLSVWGIIFSIIIPFVLSFFVLTLSCLLGWVVALINSKVKNKSFFTVVLSLAFIAAYYYVYNKAYEMLLQILANAQAIAENVKNILYPFYHMGLAAEGNMLSMLIFSGIILAAFVAVYLLLSYNFIKMATSNKGVAKRKYKAQHIKANTAERALFQKEFKRFVSSPNYMLNCGLGIVFMIIAAVFMLIKGESINKWLPVLYQGAEDMIPLLVTAALAMLSSMNDITAPSVSLEGKNLWLIQVMPVSGWQALKAKLKLHLLLTYPPAVILCASALIVFKPEAPFMILIPLSLALFILAMAMFGLFMNLKAPNLNWTNEVVPIKQSLSVTISLLGGWAVVILFGVLFFAVNAYVRPAVYLLIVCLILCMADVLLLRWLKNKGTDIIENL